MQTRAKRPDTPLRRWRKAKKLTLEEAGKLFKLSVSRMSEIEGGQGCSLPKALEIEELTEGAVTCKDLRSRTTRPDAGEGAAA